MKTGFIRLEIPVMLQNIAGILITTSLDSGVPNTNIPVRAGEEKIRISGSLNLNDELFTMNMEVPVIITDKQITKLTLPYLSILEDLCR